MTFIQGQIKLVQRKCVHVVAFISHKFKTSTNTSVDRYDKKNYKSVKEYKHFDELQLMINYIGFPIFHTAYIKWLEPICHHDLTKYGKACVNGQCAGFSFQ